MLDAAARGAQALAMSEPLHQIDVEAVKARLIERRAELLAISEASAESRKTVELDQTMVGRLSRIDALQSQEMALEQERRRAVEVKRIEAALKRIEDGDYGYCITCGAEIPLKRLELDPAVPTCVDCAR